MASTPIIMKRDGSGSRASKLALYLNPPPGAIDGSAWHGLGGATGDVSRATIAAGIPIFDVTYEHGVHVHDKDGITEFGQWCENHGITGAEYDRLSGAVGAAEPGKPYLTACVPVFSPTCVLSRGGRLVIEGGSLWCRVGFRWAIGDYVVPEIAPSIEASFHCDWSEVDYHNRVVVYYERPSLYGSDEEGALVEEVAGRPELGTPWPEDWRRGCVRLRNTDEIWAGAWEGWGIPADRRKGTSQVFLGTAARDGYTTGPITLQEEHDDAADAAQYDRHLSDQERHILRVPPRGNLCRPGLYKKGGEVVAVVSVYSPVYGQHPDEADGVPHSTLNEPYSGNPVTVWPERGAWFDDPGLHTRYHDTLTNDPAAVAELTESPVSLRERLWFKEWTNGELATSCIGRVFSGNGRVSNNGYQEAHFAFSYCFAERVTINGRAPKEGVEITQDQGSSEYPVRIRIPLSLYWETVTRDGVTCWAAGQTLVVEASGSVSMALVGYRPGCGFSAFEPQTPDVMNVEFDDFEQFPFGTGA